MSSQFELTFQKKPIPMIILDPSNYAVLEYNQALLDLSKYNSYELKNISALELFAKDKEESKSIQKLSLYENEVFSGLWRLKDKLNKVYNITLVSTPAQYKGKPARLIIAIDAEEIVKSKEIISSKYLQLSDIHYISPHNVRQNVANIMALGSLIGILSKDEIEKEGIHQKMAYSAKMLDVEIKNLIKEASKN